MQKIYIYLVLISFLLNFNSSYSITNDFFFIEENSNYSDSLIQYDIDKSKWLKKSHPDVISYFTKITGQKPGFTEEQLVGVYSLKESPIISYPFIMILNTELKGELSDNDEFAKSLNAIPAELEGKFEKDQLVNEYVKKLKVGQQSYIKEKGLILMETIAQRSGGVELIVRQGLFIRGDNLVAVQLTYVKDKDEEHLNAFNKIINTFNYKEN